MRPDPVLGPGGDLVALWLLGVVPLVVIAALLTAWAVTRYRRRHDRQQTD